MNTETILITGYPAAGKTTVAEQFTSKGYVRLNRDTEGGSVSDLIPKMISIAGKQSVVLDNTFSTPESRIPFITAAKKAGAKVICIDLTTSIEDAQINVCLRMLERYGHVLSPDEIKRSKDPNMFPPAVLFKYRKEFVVPAMSEGFDEIRRVEFNRKWNPNWKGKALFLDYDDTLRKTKSGGKWPTDPDDIEILPNRKLILQRYIDIDKGYLLFGISNQSGVSENNPPEKVARDCFDKTNRMLGIKFPYSFCPHRSAPISCYCRKPMPGMVIEFMFKYQLDPASCIFVGDKTSDQTCATRANCKFVWANDFFK